MSVYDFQATTIDGRQVSLREFQGKVLLIVNVASRCGFTPQYAGLQDLYRRYQDRGFAVLGFPSNQFGQQEPGSNSEIQTFCDTKYAVRFPLFSKVDVNGSDAHPLFEYLKKDKPGLLGTRRIKWNFTKFLIDRQGRPLRRYSPRTAPVAIEEDIRIALQPGV